jgi:dTDP-4-dehydrorhamnose 3,5-epimerase
MHYQGAPFEEAKVVRCTRGAIYDVIIDLRSDSPTYRQWFSAELSAENRRALYIPEGFAHGFQTLADNSELIPWPNINPIISAQDNDWELS